MIKEGSFAVLKGEPCLSKIRKRGILAVSEECLLSVMALSLKHMVKALFFTLRKYEFFPRSLAFIPYIDFANRSSIETLRYPIAVLQRR